MVSQEVFLIYDRVKHYWIIAKLDSVLFIQVDVTTR